MRAWVTSALTIGVSAAALWLAWRLADGVTAFGALPWPAPGWVCIVLGLHVTLLALLTLRWWLLARLFHGPQVAMTFRVFGVLIWGGQGLSQVALGPVSADAVRILGLRALGMDTGASVRLVLFDRIIGLAGLLTIGAMALCVIFPVVQVLVWLVVFLMIGIVAVLILTGTARFSDQLDKVRTEALLLLGKPRACALVLMSAATHGVNIAIYYCIALAVGLTPPFAATITSVASGLLSATLPVSFGGWGLRELTISQAFAAQGAEFPAAVTVSVLFAFTHIAIGIPGLILLIIRTPAGAMLPRN